MTVSAEGSLLSRSHLPRLAAVGAIVGGVGLAFLGAGRWLSPHALTPSRLIDTFEQVNGPHSGFRRNHAKGLGARGWFESNGQGGRLSRALVFRAGRVPVIGRFAYAGGSPDAADSTLGVRSMALLFSLPDGQEWRTGMNAIPVFPVRTPEAFRDQLVALAADPKTGKPDPAKVHAFFEAHPESERAVRRIRMEPRGLGFAESTFNGLNAFELVDATGHATPVRWSMVPIPADSTADAPSAALAGPNASFDRLIAQVHEHPLQWRLVLTVGEPGDPTNDATVEWPADRAKLDVGTLTIDAIESEQTSPARTINYDPLVLPDGIRGSDDPLLSARSAAYAESFRRRAGERVTPSAVTPAEVAR
jgi:catalase